MAPRLHEHVSEPARYVLSQSPPHGCPSFRARGNWLLQSAGQPRLTSSAGTEVSDKRGVALESARKPAAMAPINVAVEKCMVRVGWLRDTDVKMLSRCWRREEV